jgi:WD40 repeat protein
LCYYLIALTKKIPGEVLLPPILDFLESSSDRVDVTEQLSKIFLSRPLITNLYSSSDGEYFVSNICRFLFRQLCNEDEPKGFILDRNTVGVFFTSLLAQDDVLGVSICCHYIVPLLLENVELCSNRSCGNMIVKSIKNILPFLPEDAIGVLICKKILRKIMPKVLSRRGSTNVDNVEDVIFLNELVVLLQHCLRHFDSENIAQYFFHTNCGCISNVLSSSMTWTLCCTKHSTKGNENCYEELLKGASSLVCDMFRLIESDQLHDTLLPLLESFCNHVNDSHLTDVINESVLPRDGEKREEVLSLPGVRETNAMLNEALKFCDEGVLKTSCPSVIEFLAFLNPPEERTHKSDEIAAKEFKEKVFLNEKESNSISDGVASLYLRSISSSNSNKIRESSYGMSIEMLSSKERNAAKESSAKDDAKMQKKTRLLRSASSFSRKSAEGNVTRNVKEKHDLVWLLGLHKQDKEERIKYSWRPRFMLSAKLHTRESSRSDSNVHINCMASNQSESVLASGNSDGELLIFDLRRHPPSLCARHCFPPVGQSNEPARPIQQVGFVMDRILACDGGLHLFDVEALSTVTSLSSGNAFFNDQGTKPWMCEDLLAFSSFPRGTGSTEILCGSMVDLCAISSAQLYTIDMRCSDAFTSHNFVTSYGHSQPDALFKSMSWYTGIVATKEYSRSSRSRHEKSILSPEQDPSFNFTCLTSHCGGGDWICVGSSSGYIHCFDRRRGKLLACWKAHQKAVIYIRSISRHKLISASADKTAVLWNIMSSPPQKISTIYNIPGKEHSMNIASHHFREDGLVSIPDGDLILCAVAGRKTLFLPMPTELQPDGSPWEVKADRIVMSDCEGNPISSSEKLKVSSIALLPCRQLVLLGSVDIHVCL